MIRVLYISHESTSVLGSSHSLYNMISSLRGKVSPVVFVPKRGAAYDFFKAKGIQCYVIPYPLCVTNKSGVMYYVSFAPRYIRDAIACRKANKKANEILSELKVDILHSNSSVVDWGWHLAQKLNKPHVWHIREFQNLDFGLNPLMGWRHMIDAVTKSSATISITRAIRSHFKQDKNLNGYQYFNAVRSISDIKYIEKKSNYFLLCGNLTPAKGIDVAIKAFAEFFKKKPNYKLLLIGNIKPDYKAEILSLAKDLLIKSNIEFVAYSSEVDTYFQKATGYLMCSKNEAMGRVTIEAMFNGCPVIGYNGGGTKEIIQHKVNGFLFNTVEECAELMVKVTDTSIAKALIKAGHKTARNQFSEEVYCERIMQVYTNALNK